MLFADYSKVIPYSGPQSHEVDSGPVLRKPSIPRSASRVKQQESQSHAHLPSKPTISDFSSSVRASGADSNDSTPRKLNPLRPSNGLSSPNKLSLSASIAPMLGPDADPNQFSATQLFSSMVIDKSPETTGQCLFSHKRDK